MDKNEIKNEIELKVAYRLFNLDLATLRSLLSTEKDNIFQMLNMPYYALFYKSAHEFLNIEDDSIHIKSIRDAIKFFSNSATKTKARLNTIDEEHDKFFKNKILSRLLINKNIHDNLGIYFDEKKRIIGTTQQISNSLNLINKLDEQKNRQNMHNDGFKIAKFISNYYEVLHRNGDDFEIKRRNAGLNFPHYFDINTNKAQHIFDDRNTKDISLLFLYLLSNMNFVEVVLKSMLESDNTWLFRIRYIVNYYTIIALQKYNNYCNSNKLENHLEIEIDKLLTYSNNLFSSDFRSCMMHYRINEPLNKAYFDMNKPFCGLIESYFDGKNFEVINYEHEVLSNIIIKFLNKQFNMNSIRMKKF